MLLVIKYCLFISFYRNPQIKSKTMLRRYVEQDNRFVALGNRFVEPGKRFIEPGRLTNATWIYISVLQRSRTLDVETSIVNLFVIFIQNPKKTCKTNNERQTIMKEIFEQSY